MSNLPLQTAPVTHENQYILDNAVANGDISVATHLVTNLYLDRSVIDEIIHRERPEKTWRATKAMCEDLERTALQVIREAPRELYHSYIAHELLGYDLNATQSADCLSDWAYKDAIKGGCYLPFRRKLSRRQQVPEVEETPIPHKRLYEKLVSSRYIRRYTRLDHMDLLDQYWVKGQMIRQMPYWPDAEAAWALNEECIKQRKLIDERQKLLQAALIEDYNQRTGAFSHIPKRKPRVLSKQDRKVLRKSLGFASTIVGEDKARAFVRGEPVTIEGEAFVLEVERSGRLINQEHALRINVLSPQRQQLSGICVYVEDTPALDQLAALQMFVDAGEEQKILDTGNLYAVTPHGYSHPLITSRAEPDPLGPDMLRRYERLVEGESKRRRDFYRAYQKKVNPLYREALIAQSLGTRAGAFFRWIAAANTKKEWKSEVGDMLYGFIETSGEQARLEGQEPYPEAQAANDLIDETYIQQARNDLTRMVERMQGALNRS